MAYISENQNSFGATVVSAVYSVASTIVQFFEDVSKAASRSEIIAEMQSMDDATLHSKYGISRSQIVAYVFRDKMVP